MTKKEPAVVPVVNDPTIMDDPRAPEVFAEGALGFFLKDGNVHVTFSAARIDHRTSPGQVNRVVIGRIVMPIAGACGLAVGLYDFMKKHGAIPDQPFPQGEAPGRTQWPPSGSA
jgi:hypothetical protein